MNFNVLYWDVQNLTQDANGTVLLLLFYILQEYKLRKTHIEENETRFILTFSTFVFANGQ